MAKKRKNKVRNKVKKEPYVPEYTFPLDEDDVEACKARVADGMKCYCLEQCGCRECNECEVPTCLRGCKTCSNHKPCVHCS